MPTNRRRTLPNASAKLDSQTRQFLEAVSEIVETGEGVRGHPLDRKITLRDLIDSGIGKVIGSGSKIGNLKPGDDLGVAPPDMSTPPKPEGFFATGGFYGMISLSWSIPGELYGNHAYTNVYRSEVDNFANAETIGREAGAFYTDIVRQDAIDPDDPTRLKGYYYWITFVSTAGVEGPPNDSNGTFARPLIDVGYLLDVLNGQLSESQLNKDLQARVDKIEVNETAIKQEQEVRQSGDEALSRSIDSATATLNGNITAAVREEREARVSKDDALSRQINTVQTSLGNRIGSVEETMEVQGNTIDGITAEYTLKLDVNGYIAGIGAINDGTRSQIVFRADQIAFSPPAGKGNGRAFPVVYDSSVRALVIDTAMIKDGSIQSGQLGAVQSGKLFLPDGRPVTTAAGLIRAEALDVDNISVASAATFHGDVKSGNYRAGSQGWFIQQSGRFEFQQGVIGDRVQIGGYDAEDVARFANLSNQRIDDWVKPNTTLIDGNKIFTGDAYVDTLQIKDQAITIDASNFNGPTVDHDDSWRTVNELEMDPQGQTLDVLLSFSYEVDVTILQGGSYNRKSIYARIVAGSFSYDFEASYGYLVDERNYTEGQDIRRSLVTVPRRTMGWTGNRTVRIQLKGDSNGSLPLGYISTWQHYTKLSVTKR